MIRTLSLALTCLLAACTTTARQGVSADYLFERVHVIPMDSETVLRDQAVAVKDGVIIAIIDQEDADSITATNRVDGAGRYLMPGLADMHVHIRWNPATMFKLFLSNGVTTVFNMRLADGDGAYDHLALREAIASGQMIGPRYLVSGPQLRKDTLPDSDAIDAVLDDAVAKGYDTVKVHGDLPPDMYSALVQGARHRNLRIGGHTQHMLPLARSLTMNRIEHIEEFLYVAEDDLFAGTAEAGNFLEIYRENAKNLQNPAQRRSVAAAVSQSGTFLNPTLVVYANIATWADDDRLIALRNDPSMAYLPQSTKDTWLSLEDNPYQVADFPLTVAEVESNVETLKALLKDFHDAGVPLLSGSDGFGTLVPGLSLHQELGLMTQAGLSPHEALQTSTVNVAAYLGEGESAGKIRPGYQADFILLDKNPLNRIENVGAVSGVFTLGRWHSRAELEGYRAEARER